MIPTKLRISGFLSYQQPAELDFNGLGLACISGANGAGKSSLLDAITWALFGQARCRDDDALVNSFADAAEVIFDFEYEQNAYRVQRSKPRGKTTLLELFVRAPEGGWRALTERSVRETENRIKQILRMDYDTFTNASFFLQGHADQFAQQAPAERKKVLSNVLGLEAWESYRVQAVAQRRTVEAETAAIDAQLADIESELAQEEERKQRLVETEAQLQQAVEAASAKEAEMNVLQRLAASLADQKRLLDVLEARLGETSRRCDRLAEQIASLQEERARLEGELARSAEIEQAYQQWQADRQTLERWDQMADSFHEVQARRTQPLAEVSAALSRLEEEQRGLLALQDGMQQEGERLTGLEAGLPALAADLQTVEAGLRQRSTLQTELQTLQQQAAAMEVENRQLRSEMLALKERLDQLNAVEGAVCPLCGQSLSPAERIALMAGLEADGKRMGDAYRLNQSNRKQGEERILALQAQLTDLATLDDQLRILARQHDQAEAEIERLRAALAAWKNGGALRLQELEGQIARGDYAAEARRRLAGIDDEARQLGYDTVAHDAVRQVELAGRTSEVALRDLQAARASFEPLTRQIDGLAVQLAAERAQRAVQTEEFTAAEAHYQEENANLPNLAAAEQALMDLKARENRLRMEVGMVRQLVTVLDRQRQRKARLQEARAAQSVQINRLKALERAFGKDGVPALLIEQALPEIQEQANTLLDRLSGGGMSVIFETQRQLKNKKKEMRETLDIKITDERGKAREYEMFSGGEAFRINFAIRLALSRVLAHRAGARLQTLFIDEGFGSQDAEGRQRLLQAINQVCPEFARILVITHMEELKDAFPARIEVEKTAMGSAVKVLT